MAKFSSTLRKKLLDFHVGIMFDWRRSGDSGSWVVYTFMLIFALLAILLYHYIQIDLIPRSARPAPIEGHVLYVKRPLYGADALHSPFSSPLPPPIPNWADPVHTEMLDAAIPKSVVNPDRFNSTLANITPQDHLSEDAPLLSSFLPIPLFAPSLPAKSVVEQSIPCIAFSSNPFLSQAHLPTTPTSVPAHYSMHRTQLFVIVSSAGIPESVIITASCGIPQADQSAYDYVNGLRWNMQDKPQSTLLDIKWIPCQSNP